ncbi:MAG: hypothetical protein OHK0048_26840 [Rhodoferax sp.]
MRQDARLFALGCRLGLFGSDGNRHTGGKLGHDALPLGLRLLALRGGFVDLRPDSRNLWAIDTVLYGYAGKRPAQLNESFIKLGDENIER